MYWGSLKGEGYVNAGSRTDLALIIRIYVRASDRMLGSPLFLSILFEIHIIKILVDLLLDFYKLSIFNLKCLKQDGVL